MGSIEKYKSGILAGQEPAKPVGKALLYGGSGALAVGLIAALLPFGSLFWAIAVILLGLMVI